MKRFTETEKWNDPWFRKLTPRLKCLWQYFCDICDAAGVITDIDWELASFRIGEPASPEDMKHFQGRIEKHPTRNHYLICTFIHFQYGALRFECRGQRTAIRKVKEHQIQQNTEGQQDTENTSYRVCNEYGYHWQKSLYPARLGSGSVLTKGTRSTGVGGVGEGVNVNGKPSCVEELMTLLRDAYKRDAKDRFDYFEEFTISEIAQRPKCIEEMHELIAYRGSMKDPRFFPKSVRGLLEAWNKTLDRARQDSSLIPASGGFGDGLSKADIEAQKRREIEELQQMPVAQRGNGV